MLGGRRKTKERNVGLTFRDPHTHTLLGTWLAHTLPEKAEEKQTKTRKPFFSSPQRKPQADEKKKEKKIKAQKKVGNKNDEKIKQFIETNLLVQLTLTLAKVGLAKVGHVRLAIVGLAKVGGQPSATGCPRSPWVL